MSFLDIETITSQQTLSIDFTLSRTIVQSKPLIPLKDLSLTYTLSTDSVKNPLQTSIKEKNTLNTVTNEGQKLQKQGKELKQQKSKEKGKENQKMINMRKKSGKIFETLTPLRKKCFSIADRYKMINKKMMDGRMEHFRTRKVFSHQETNSNLRKIAQGGSHELPSMKKIYRYDQRQSLFSSDRLETPIKTNLKRKHTTLCQKDIGLEVISVKLQLSERPFNRFQKVGKVSS